MRSAAVMVPRPARAAAVCGWQSQICQVLPGVPCNRLEVLKWRRSCAAALSSARDDAVHLVAGVSNEHRQPSGALHPDIRLPMDEDPVGQPHDRRRWVEYASRWPTSFRAIGWTSMMSRSDRGAGLGKKR